MAEVTRKRTLEGDGPQNVRKKLRPSELPLPQSKRLAIDTLVHTFRKKGQYDSIRKELLAQYEASPAKDDLLSALKDLVEDETDANPSLLSKDPHMATTLIEGAGERKNIYANIMNTVGTLLDKLIKEQGLPKMREYRSLEIGTEAAAEEEARGSKTEEEWAREAEVRRQEREAIREKELEHQRQIEREERAKKEERKRQEREQEKAREEERQKEKERRRLEREKREKEDEERRRQDRERIEQRKEEERKRVEKEKEEHEANREARLKKIREEDAARTRRIEEELDQDRDRGGRYRGGRGRSRTPERDRSRDRARGRDRSKRRSRSRSHERRKTIKPEDIKVDDDLALQLLLQESEQMKKSRQRPVLERSESLEPPMRKAHPPKLLVPRDPATVRLAKLDSKSQSPVLGSLSKESTTPSGDNDVPMEDAPPTEKSQRTTEKSRWETALPPLPSKGDRSRVLSKSPSVAHNSSMRKRSRTRSPSRGSRYERRASRTEDDRRSRRDDDRHSYRPRDDRDDRRSRRGSRSRSRETHSSRRKSRYQSRSPAPKDREHDRRRERSASRSRGGHRTRDRTPPRRRNRSRSRSPDGIDRYVPGGGGVAVSATPSGGAEVRKQEESRDRKRGDSRDHRRDDDRPRKRDDRRDDRRDDSRDRTRSYRSREYDRWDGGRSRGNRFDESDRWMPGGGGDDKGLEKKGRDRSRSRDGGRDKDRDDRDRRRRARSRTRSVSHDKRR
ncbi:complex proteins associated with Set1p component shg1-domain-containing protein [Phaeosphaeriaceae sp. PMI808]|nr:complex proteins associated with Set1p component shg1-domain-containing protein [Phaeosphaeriaceae sp. PMI808]